MWPPEDTPETVIMVGSMRRLGSGSAAMAAPQAAHSSSALTA